MKYLILFPISARPLLGIFFLVMVFSLSAQEQYQRLKSQSQKWQGVDLDSALMYADAMLEMANSLQDHQKISESILLKGLAYGYMDDFQNEILYYRKALEYASSHNDSLGIGKSYINMGVNNYYKGNLDSAAFFYELARGIFQTINEERFLGFSLNNLGQVYTRVEKYDQAKAAYNEALKIKISQKDTSAIMNTYFNLASLSMSEELFQEALEYSKQTLQYAEHLGDSATIGAAYINLGLSSIRLGNYDKGLLYSAKADSYRDAINIDPELVLGLHSLAVEISIQKSDWQKAKYRLSQMKSFLRDDAFTESQMKYFNLKSQIEINENDYQNAFQSLQTYHRIKDDFLSESVQKNVVALEKKYESESKDKQITVLELEKKNAALILSKSTNQRNVLIAVSLIVIIVAILLFILFSQKRKSLAERDVLLKEIHHRVKNNLQVISSLLNLQADSLDDNTAKDAVKEGQHRVKSMALIHQKLYSTDDVRGVNVQGYLEQLTSELFKAFGVDQEKVDFQIETSNLKMDIDTVIPLGLIINELITNSIKYAFQNTGNGLLEISIKEEGESLKVVVKDNGKGMDEEAIKASNSFGWKMIKSLSRKLKAEIIVDGTSGTNVQLNLSRYKLVS
ncbi:MAG: histidine kinase dimerization/phosphoacceptor domain -containing protein [Ekhidna sp.]